VFLSLTGLYSCLSLLEDFDFCFPFKDSPHKLPGPQSVTNPSGSSFLCCVSYVPILLYIYLFYNPYICILSIEYCFTVSQFHFFYLHHYSTMTYFHLFSPPFAFCYYIPSSDRASKHSSNMFQESLSLFYMCI
jgi:hypothetical protein